MRQKAANLLRIMIRLLPRLKPPRFKYWIFTEVQVERNEPWTGNWQDLVVTGAAECQPANLSLFSERKLIHHPEPSPIWLTSGYFSGDISIAQSGRGEREIATA